MTKKIYPQELIGKEITVIQSKNKYCLGIMGKVIDETKMTLKVQQKDKIKTLLKNSITFKLPDGEIIVGKEITKRPEDRLAGK